MAGTKTGIGGFEIDGKVYDYDLDDPNSPGTPKEKLPNPDPGDIKVDKTVKDLSKGTRETLAGYLKTVTTNNSYPSDGKFQDAKITDDNGLPHQLSDNPNNDAHFTDRAKTSGVTPGPQGDPAAAIKGLSKGKQAPKVDPSKPGDRKDGHTLLPSVEKDKTPNVITAYTSTVLKNNRFSPATAATPTAVMSSEPITGNGNDGKPSAGYNPSLRHPRYGDVSLKRLAQVGTALSLRASQELNAASAGNNPTSGGTEAGALLPGINQLGASRVDTVVLEAADVLKSLTSSEVPDGDFLNISDVSWGALNNVDDPWSGITALGMIALSAALTAAIVLLIEALGFLLGLIKGSTGNARNLSGRYVLGRSSVVKASDPNAFPPALPPDIGALLGLRTTTFPFSSAVKSGVEAFFGIDSSGGIGGALLSGLSSATQNPGFNSIIARTIIRSGIVIVDSFKKAFSSPNIVAGIKNILNIIDTIRSSKLIAALNAFATVGDLTLTDPGDIYKSPDAIPEEPIKKSQIDSLPDETLHATVQKNRLRGTMKLAWSNSRAPAMYLVPETVLGYAAADTSLGAFKGSAALFDPGGLSKRKDYVQKKGDAKSSGARIPTTGTSDSDPFNVEAFEAALDAEYVPFSFHDLRTNEIVSFHAFLASMSDDYTANYENVDGYGRVDPVKIYKSTTRKIGMSFYIIATSEHDFDEMWMKINKLTTLVYPQYSRGRLLTNTDKNLKFVQPFSQLIAASPMIRIRLGDLFRSNYSRFALARLFGLGGAEDLKFGDGADVKVSEGAGGKLDILKLSLTSPEKGNTYILQSDNWPQADAGGLSISPPLPLASGGEPKQAPSMQIYMHDAPYIILKVKDEAKAENPPTFTVELMTAADITEQYKIDTETATKIADSLKAKYENGPIKYKIVGDAAYKIPVAYVKPTQKTLDTLFAKHFKTEVTSIEKVSEFLDAEKNALVRSFHSVRGKGLAGVVETMNFDWYDKVTWETKTGSTAPKMCKVTIAFSPIHDVSPGIDHMGYNRAPIYPVGAAMGHTTDKEGKKGK